MPTVRRRPGQRRCAGPAGMGYHSHSNPSETPCEKIEPFVLTFATGLETNWSCSGANATPEIHMKSQAARPIRFGRNL